MFKIFMVFCLSVFVIQKTQAFENQKPLVPLPSVPDFTHGAGWGLAIGVGSEYESAYDGSDEYEFEVEPAGGVHYRSGDNLIFWEGMELGWRGLVNDAAYSGRG